MELTNKILNKALLSVVAYLKLENLSNYRISKDILI